MRVVLIVVAVAGVTGAALAGFAVARSLTDPRPVISPMVVPGLSSTTAVGPGSSVPSGSTGTNSSTTTPGAATGTGVAPGRATAQQVPGLQQLVGVLRQDGGLGDWSVSGVDIDLGPGSWLATAGPIEDYDGDGRRESMLDELRGLQGRSVTLGVRFELDGDLDDADVFLLEGRPFRDPAGGPAPWQVRPAGTEATREQVVAAAVAATGAGAVALEVDRESSDGWIRWEVDVLAATGREYEVFVDVAGVVLDIRPDDDGGLFRRAAGALNELVS
jgi:hypothetical protein